MVLTVLRRVRKALRAVGGLSSLPYLQRSFSQEGEDQILLRFFANRRDGFYVDVGAHHPYRFSNTQALHELGWRGVNIDAMPGSMKPFRRVRAHDCNIEVGIGAEPGTARLHVFNEPALNTFDADVARMHTRGTWRVERTVDVLIQPLAQVLEENVPAGRHIDVMSVDVEGRDLEVLQSNDWVRFRPTVVLAEALGTKIDDLGENEVVCFLRARGYVLLAKTINTVFLLNKEQK